MNEQILVALVNEMQLLRMEIEELRKQSQSHLPGESIPQEVDFTSNYNNNLETLDEKISSILYELKIPSHVKGFPLLREAIKMVFLDMKLLGRMTSSLYPTLANDFETSPSKVERAIRHAIEISWSKRKFTRFYSKYSISAKPSNSHLIALIADNMRLSKISRDVNTDVANL